MQKHLKGNPWPSLIFLENVFEVDIDVTTGYLFTLFPLRLIQLLEDRKNS